MTKLKIRNAAIILGVVLTLDLLIRRGKETALERTRIQNKARISATVVPPDGSSKSPPPSGSKGRVPDPALTPALAKSRIEEFFLKTSDLAERCKFASELFVQLCQNGFSEEAFQMLDKNYGSVRSSEITTLFGFADLPNSELLKRVAEVSVFKWDREKALWGYLGRTKSSDLVETVSDPEFKQVFPNAAEVSFKLGDKLQQIAAEAGGIKASGPEYLQMAKKLVDKGYLTPFDFMYYATQDQSSGDAFERWNQIQQVIPSGTLTDTSGTVMGNPGETLIAQMVIKDAPKTLANLLKVEDYRSINSAILQWTHNDPSGAAQWYGSTMNQLNPRQNDAVSEAFASTAISSAEFEGARAWAEKMQDPVAKKNLMDVITEKENKLLADRAVQEERKKSIEGK